MFWFSISKNPKGIRCQIWKSNTAERKWFFSDCRLFYKKIVPMLGILNFWCNYFAAACSFKVSLFAHWSHDVFLFSDCRLFETQWHNWNGITHLTSWKHIFRWAHISDKEIILPTNDCRFLLEAKEQNKFKDWNQWQMAKTRWCADGMK